MASKVKSVNLLPGYLQTDKNSKFLSSTLDQLIQPAELERIDGFIGSKLTPTYVSTTDNYISEGTELRSAYALNPALIVNDVDGTICDVIALDDLVNEIAVKGGISNNLDRLFRTEFYSFNPHVDWDKLINYQEYYWLATGPNPILIHDDALNVDTDIIGRETYTSLNGITVSNGMLLRFSGDLIGSKYQNGIFFVEGVGTSIVLVNYDSLMTAGKVANAYDEIFDGDGFDEFPFDGSRSLPIAPEYITINRASKDLNPWSRYNRWVHQDVITASAAASGQAPVYPEDKRARRPIIEFNAGLKLFNFGVNAVQNVDFIDNVTKDAFSTIEGAAGFYVDPTLLKPTALQHGNRVIFNADTDPAVRGKIYEVQMHLHNGHSKIALVPADDHSPAQYDSVSVINGAIGAGSSWWFNGSEWVYAQQHTKLNESPLFDLFDFNGNSYSDQTHYVSNFKGNAIFGYEIGTGSNDSVLGFPVAYRNSIGVGSYLFKNYFTTDTIDISVGQDTTTISTENTYCKINDEFANVWTVADNYQIPVLQFQSITEPTTTLEVIAIDKPTVVDLTLEVFVGNNKLTNYTISKDTGKLLLNFDSAIAAGTSVLIKLYTDAVPNSNGYYETPIGLTNNPLNGPIASVTLTDLEAHLVSMVQETTNFVGTLPGKSNLRDLPNLSKYGRRLVSNANPLTFAQMFVGKKEHSVLDAIVKAGDQYNQFKLGFLKQIISLNDQLDPVTAVDEALAAMNLDKNLLSPYYLSDMTAYGTDLVSRTWTVTNVRNVSYPTGVVFDPTTLSTTSLLVYLNDVQLLVDIDYTIDTVDSKIVLVNNPAIGDKLVVKYYPNTSGSYVPPTPTKLGLYPKFTPSIYVDSTYPTGEVSVIQGHDGSILLAYGDYRDAIILELEKRIYNNLKTEYRAELFDINSALPGAFKDTSYSVDEINSILQQDFIKWAGAYSIDYSTNYSYVQDDPFTWNFKGAYSSLTNEVVSGSWRSLFKRFYGTDRPHTSPWEMLGFTERPTWWEEVYGPAPYTSGNEILWDDLERGSIQGVINPLYARPGLSTIIPVDDSGNLVPPTVALVTNTTPYNQIQDWVFGDCSPAEITWRQSSYWPFAVQRLLALIKPATYTSLMYDVSRMTKNLAGQWTYGDNKSFLKLTDLVIQGKDSALTAGYSTYLNEVGRQRTQTYNTELQSDLDYLSVNLFHKVGGFVSKNTLQVTIDAIDPTSTGQGSLLSPEDYKLILNVSNPIKAVSISGIIIQKVNGKFVVKGYDKINPYFNTYGLVRNSTTPTLTVGGVSEAYVTWTSSSTTGQSGLTDAQTTTASASPTGIFYAKGQVVKYGSNFYRVQIAHQSESAFNPALYQVLPALPIIGGVVVQIAERVDTTKVTKVAYGTSFNTIQDVYDFIIGYGEWLTAQGFEFNEYNTDFGSTVDWTFTAKEFMYWTTQNWSNNSVITLSPFADQVQYKLANSVVDNVFNKFYEYSILQANGSVIPQDKLSVNRQDGLCTISTLDGNTGIYFLTLRSVQKEHGMVFNNDTIFKDTIYSIDTGFYQQRMKLSGFRTANWDGDYFSPGFVYDTAVTSEWKQYTSYNAGDVVKFAGKYYSAIKKVDGAQSFNFANWDLLSNKPTNGLLPNFDYKISQFDDFYSLDIDNFDEGQQKLAQHLTGYTPRVYLNNIFTDPIAQYKFYQGFIREKGTKNAITKLSKATIRNHQGEISYNEEWAFRVGHYGSFSSYQELEAPLIEGTFIDNPQVVVFADVAPPVSSFDLKYYSTASSWSITPTSYVSSMTFITSPGTYQSNDLVLPTAGYVRNDDTNYTVRTKEDLVSLVTDTDIKEGDIFWVGFLSNSDWDVLRYTKSLALIVNQSVDVPGSSITFETNDAHGLTVGDIISVAGFSSALDGIYVITAVPNLISFTVASENNFTVGANPDPGLLFTFKSARFNTFDDLPNNSELLDLAVGSKAWIDNNGNDNWAVYEKINNYSETATSNISSDPSQQFGWSISKPKGSDLVLIGSPGFAVDNNYGRVSLYKRNGDALNRKLFYYLNEVTSQYNLVGTPTEFGHSVVYDDTNFLGSGYGLMYVGAPGAYTTSTVMHSGLVKVSSVDPVIVQELKKAVMYSPSPTSYERFGSSIYAQQGVTNNKLCLVGAPGTITTGTGAVYAYHQVINVGAKTVTPTLIQTLANPVSGDDAVGTQWGYSINGSEDGSVIAITSLGNSKSRGRVCVYTYNGTTLTLAQTIVSPYAFNSQFGYKVLVSPDANYMIVTAPYHINEDQTSGKVLIYVNNNGTFELDQEIISPAQDSGVQFGISVDINQSNNALVVSSLGSGIQVPNTFDANSVYVQETTFDLGATSFYGTVDKSGTVYVYNRYDTRFIIAEQLSPVNPVDGTDFGQAVTIDDDIILVGAPAYDNLALTSELYQFTKIDKTVNGWKLIHEQSELVSLDTVQRVTLIDTYNDEVISYLDVIDPLKGRISGIADQELSYKMAVDPAIYSVGSDSTAIDLANNWVDFQVGQLWWDLSTVKYQWYEQGDNTFRKNNWGKLFPGASIDVYEWVGTNLLPSEWGQLADTSVGLAQGISGQPKFADDSVYSVKQVYDVVSNSFSNFYFYWVKNKATVPSNVKNRRVSCYDVSQIILDPTSYGLQYAGIISASAITLANVGPTLVDDRVSINISIDELRNEIPRHTEWLLLQEGSPDSVPNTMLENKMIDSLLGRDKLGNFVPDTSLPARTRYGIGIRPRQTMFKDRLAALRNIIDFANTTLLQHNIVGNRRFNNLLAEEQIPDSTTNLYDLVIEDNDALLSIDTDGFIQAELHCSVSDGKLRAVFIDNPGRGYLVAPTVTITSAQGAGAVITTTINSNGSVIAATVTEAGKNYVAAPKLEVRPFTVIVLADVTYNGKWAEFVYDSNDNNWVRNHTQQYNTPLYWNYIDWADESYNSYRDYTYTVTDVYQTDFLDLAVGDYVKVANGGLGTYIILEKVESNGTFSSQYNLVFAEKGTIQISNDIWNVSASNYGYDKIKTYDQTLYDQAPDIELENILKALRDDIFIDDLKINWNLLFFKAVKYAMTEQKLLDWAFKTSFISVRNNAGELSQPPVYKITSSTYFEQYIEEVKPYHTQIRNFTEDYTVTEPTNTQAEDFITNFNIGMKFDRISRAGQLGELSFTDTFICNGSSNSFELSWLARPDKKLITVTLDKHRVLWSDYTIEYYTKVTNGYTKQYCKVVFLNYSPILNQFLEVTYLKNTNLMNAADRILNYYSATSGMPGLELGQLMEGIDYPKTQLQTITFDYSTDWDYTPYNSTTWGDGISAYASATVSSTASVGTSTIVLSEASKLVVGQYANVVSTTTNAFQGTVTTITSIVGNTVTFNSKLSSKLEPGAVIEFWNLESNAVILDSVIDGGSWSILGRVNALGIDPADITLDGDAFYTADTSHAPEELVPGQVSDSLGINVYTKTTSGAPTVFTGVFDTNANSVTTVPLTTLPSTPASMYVTAEGYRFNYTTATNLVGGQYSIDWSAKTLSVKTAAPTRASYAIIDIGGGPDIGPGVVDNALITVVDQTEAQVVGLSNYGSILSAYVTVNGVAINQITPETTATEYGYVLTVTGSYNRRAAVDVYNLPSGTNTVHAWYFSTAYSAYNEIEDQYFAITTGSSTPTTYTLSRTPGNIGPAVANVTVDLINAAGETRETLNPPNISYYNVTNESKVFRINSTELRPSTGTNAVVFSFDTVDAYLNGIKLRQGFDYSVDPAAQTIILSPSIGKASDVLAVVDLTPTTFKFNVEGNILTINRVEAGTSYRVTTFTDHDGMLARSERFYGTPTGRYKLSAPAYNTNYIWVYFNSKLLTVNQDYQILEDGLTIQVSDSYTIAPADTVLIRYIANQTFASTVVGYRIFNDMFNRTAFKRLSKQNTTYLTQPLAFTDTTIHVHDASILTPPIPSKKIPGVIIIAGERIEFYKMKKNVLSQLRRSTLGTAPNFYSQEYTRVIDQGVTQTIPFTETTLKQVQYTTSTTATYVISTVTNTTIGDGITLSADLTVPAADQVKVYYGGRLLNKSGMYYQDTSLSYDNPQCDILGTVATPEDLPSTTIKGVAYHVTSTNQVWVYTGSLAASEVNGYVYTGLNYMEPEFTIDPVTRKITLNIQDGVGDNIKLVIVKREFSNSDLWNSGVSLLDSDTAPAKFLQSRPSELPDNYYYGGNPELIIETGFPLTDTDNRPLQGS